MEKRACVICGSRFVPRRKDQQSCSDECRKLRYERSGRAAVRKRKYETTEKGKAVAAKYAASAKGKLRRLRHYYQDRPEQLEVALNNRARWTKDVHTYTKKHRMSLLAALDTLRWISSEKTSKEVKKLFQWERRDAKRDKFLARWYWNELP